ncbi:hypothetical protein Tco_1175696 [Tanacetum coccineum]
MTSSQPTRLQDTIRMANGLKDQKVRVYAARSDEQKRKFDNNLRDNRVQQPPFKRQNMARAFPVGNNEKRGYAGSAPYCNKCRLHHEGLCTVNGQGHYKSDCPKLMNQNHANKATNNDARGRAYALGGGDNNPNYNVVTDWLSKYHAVIVCEEKLFVFPTISVKKIEDKSEEKRLEDVPIIQDFLEIFPEDLSRLPPAR